MESQYDSPSLIQMFSRKTYYSEIEKKHYKTLKIIYDINESNNSILLQSHKIARCLNSSKTLARFSE